MYNPKGLDGTTILHSLPFSTCMAATAGKAALVNLSPWCYALLLHWTRSAVKAAELAPYTAQSPDGS